MLISAPAAGAAQPSRPPYHPRADHIGVVVTAGEVLVSWHRLPTPDSGGVVVRRDEAVCPHTPTDGTAAGEVTGLHVIDRSVKAGLTYCYTVFAKDATGAVHTIGSTGAVAVPDVSAIPPVGVPAPAPAPLVTVNGLSPAFKRKIELAIVVAVAAILAGLVAVVTVRRIATARVLARPTARESIIGRNNSALVVPAMIAVGWIGVVIAFVVLR
ncbi:MAG TPA: hypothetical protein VGL44_10070 [Gaiellales bacterium]